MSPFERGETSPFVEAEGTGPQNLDVYKGRVRRRCSSCLVEVEVERPQRILNRHVSRAHRKKVRQEIAQQILWEALCDDCILFWNKVLRAVDGRDDPDERAAQIRT